MIRQVKKNVEIRLGLAPPLEKGDLYIFLDLSDHSTGYSNGKRRIKFLTTS
jgi:hypothetical protein